MRVSLLLLMHIFHFITSLVRDDRDKAVKTEMSVQREDERGGGGGGKGVLKLNGKLCTSIKTWGEHIKSHPPVPGDRMQEGKTQCEATVQSESQAFSPRRRTGEGGEERQGGSAE